MGQLGRKPLYHAATGALVYRLSNTHCAPVQTLAFAPTGAPVACLASASLDGFMRLYPERGFVCPIDAHRGGVTCMQFSPDGTRLLSGGRDRRVRLWKLSSARRLNTTPAHRGWITSVQWSPCGLYFTTTAVYTSPRVWRARNATVRCVLITQRGFYVATQTAWSSCGQLVCVADCSGNVGLHNAHNGECLADLRRPHADDVTSMAWNAYGLATVSYDGTLCVWPDKRTPRLAPLLGRSAKSPAKRFCTRPRSSSAPPLLQTVCASVEHEKR